MYDDEYDDSFDDLIAFGADGVTEMEGEEGGPAGPTGATRGGAAAGPSLAAAQRGMQGLSLQPGAASFQPGGGAAAAAAGGGRAQQPPLSTKKTKGSKLWVRLGDWQLQIGRLVRCFEAWHWCSRLCVSSRCTGCTLLLCMLSEPSCLGMACRCCMAAIATAVLPP